ncbi:MAG: hypothetical protein II738_08010 [Clostridia bacterium]|nr:hypothetical protein [Clostridia bacterium]
MNNVANIINFARGCEPRSNDDSYLLPTLYEELELCKRFRFRSTVLLQYDALVSAEYVALLQSGYDVEIGLWFEVVQPLAEDAGLQWHGRYPWDWDTRVNFLSAYTPDERTAMIDAAFHTFKRIFGAYPKVAGCWSIDAFSLDYIERTYGLSAFCICKEQYGTDGITVWGGPYTGGYYPSKKNAIVPARNERNQIGIPVFRMLGPDPIDQYDLGLGSPEQDQQVCSLEPVYRDGGGNPEWVDWFFNENYNGKAISLAYAQIGQENSFGWTDISKGLPMQLEKLRKKVDSGEIVLQTLGETGEAFKRSFAHTPPNSTCADADAKNEARKTAWYYSRYYRVNVMFEKNRAWIRDLQLYSDDYAEPYLHVKNTDTRCGTFALPVMDGFRFSEGNVRAGIFLDAPDCADFESGISDDGVLTATWGDVVFTAKEQTFSVRCKSPDFRLRFVTAAVPTLPYCSADERALYMRFRDFTDAAFEYALRLSAGRFVQTGKDIDVYPDKTGEIVFDFNGN